VRTGEIPLTRGCLGRVWAELLALSRDEGGDDTKDLKGVLVTSGTAPRRGHRIDRDVDRAASDIGIETRQSWHALATGPRHDMTSWHRQ
jgi:hypothetical protein